MLEQIVMPLWPYVVVLSLVITPLLIRWYKIPPSAASWIIMGALMFPFTLVVVGLVLSFAGVFFLGDWLYRLCLPPSP
jgi:hypothetical protein